MRIDIEARSKEQKRESKFHKIEIIKTPQSDVEVFLYNKVNIEVYDNITNFCKQVEIDTPHLVFFNLIYTELDFYFKNDNKYLEIQNHFKEMNLKIYEFIILSNMTLVIDEVYKNSEPNEVQLKCLIYLKDFFKQYVFSDKEITKLILEDYKLYNFRNRINVWKTDEEKINYLIDLKTRFLIDAVDYKGWENEYTFDKECDIEIEKLKAKIPIKEPEAIDLSTKNKSKDLTVQKWFKTGIALATGEAFEVYKKIGNLPTEICRKIGVPETNKTYISATINNLPYNDKNIFNSVEKLKALHKHITENNLKFGTVFLEKYNQIEPD